MVQGELTTDELIARVGGDVTRTQLERWLKEGLLPRPRREWLGRARGSVSFYPARTVPILQRLIELTKQSRDIEDWRWHLWLDGYRIDQDKFRQAILRELDQAQAEVHKKVASVQSHDADELDVLEAVLNDPAMRKSGLSRQLRRLKNPKDRNAVGVFILSQAFGYSPPVEWDEPVDDDGQTIEDLFRIVGGFPSHWESSEEFPGTFSLATLRSSVERATELEWRAVRRDWQAIAGAAAAFERLLEVINHSSVPLETLDPQVIAAITQAKRIQRSWVGDALILLRVLRVRAMLTGGLLELRRGPLGPMVEVVMASLRGVAAAIRAGDHETPSRRLAPSEGTASGKDPSRCTPRIPPTARSETAS